MVITFKQYLQSCTKDDLFDYARVLELTKISKLKKEDLINRIIEACSNQNRLYDILSTYSYEELKLFKKACRNEGFIQNCTLPLGVKFMTHFLGIFDPIEHSFYIYEELISHMNFFDDEEFKKIQERRSWLMQCLCFVENHYGVIPIETFHQLYQFKLKESIEEMIQLFENIPYSLMDAEIIYKPEDDDFYKENHPLYSQIGLIDYRPDHYDESPQPLLSKQGTKPFYIPTKKEIESFYTKEYPSDNRYYKELLKEYVSIFKLKRTHAEMGMYDLFQLALKESTPDQFIQTLMDAGFEFDNLNQADHFMSKVSEAWNHTPMIIHRGHTPLSIVKIMKK